jgi:bifunctional DNase/RNase
MFVNKVGLDVQKRAFVVLADADQERFLPIAIGPFEARAIAIADQTPHKRPLTHDLLLSVISNLGYRLERIEITKLEEGIFYALLHLHSDHNDQQIDARPSDALALAISADAPIYVAQSVLDGAVVLSEEAEEKEKEELRDLLSGLPLQDDDEGPEDSS